MATFHHAGFIHRGLGPPALLVSSDLQALTLVDWSTASRLSGGGAAAGPGQGLALSPSRPGG